MFTGIIEKKGIIRSIQKSGSNITFSIESELSSQLKIDQSVAHDGVCLTVIQVKDNIHQVTAIDETLKRSTLGSWEIGSEVNIERCMLNNGRFDGHIVQGHVDIIGKITDVIDQEGSWIFKVSHPANEHATVEKGSITINGISLTCFDVSDTGFSVAIIPYTFENTSMGQLKIGDFVNLEFDIIGKYVKRLLDRS